MTRDEYVSALRDLLSGDPERVRAANRLLYSHAVTDRMRTMSTTITRSEADLALAEVAMGDN